MAGWASASVANRRVSCRERVSCRDEVMLPENLILPVAEACGVVGGLGGGLAGELVLFRDQLGEADSGVIRPCGAPERFVTCGELAPGELKLGHRPGGAIEASGDGVGAEKRSDDRKRDGQPSGEPCR